jgi:K+-sensing histidine kinase KdpD
MRVLYLQDLSLQKELELTRQSKEVLRTVQATISHDLYAPINCIIGFTEIIRGLTSNPEILKTI